MTAAGAAGRRIAGASTVACRTISRFLYPCGRQPFIWAGHYCPALATYPRVPRSGPLLLSYLVLLHVGFTLPAELLRPRCALTAPFHPYQESTRLAASPPAVCFLWHFPSRFRRQNPSRPLAGTLPCGDRTFLPFPGGCPSGRLQTHYPPPVGAAQRPPPDVREWSSTAAIPSAPYRRNPTSPAASASP